MTQMMKKLRNCSTANCLDYRKQLEIEEDKLKDRDLSLVHENVTDEEIAKIISRWTGIPVAKLSESERKNTAPG